VAKAFLTAPPPKQPQLAETVIENVSSLSSFISFTTRNNSKHTNSNCNQTAATCSNNNNDNHNNNNKHHSTRPRRGNNKSNNVHTSPKNAPTNKNNTQRKASAAASTSVTAAASTPALPTIFVNITQGITEYMATIIDSTVLAVFQRKKDDKSRNKYLSTLDSGTKILIK